MYLNQLVKFEEKIQGLSNEYGEFKYYPAITLAARKQYKEQEVTDKEGITHKSTYAIYTYKQVKIDDLIDDRLVIFTEGYVTLGGIIKMYYSLTV